MKKNYMLVTAILTIASMIAGGMMLPADSQEANDESEVSEPVSSWGRNELRALPIAYRNDGFSTFYRKPPMTRETLENEFVNPLAGTGVQIIEWGLGPGSVFCYDTKAGEIVGADLTEEQWARCRVGDRWVYQNVRGLIDAGHDPLRVVVNRAHELGLRVFARLEMNHEYGPASDDNWLWLLLVGRLNKEHPEYRMPGSVRLDFKHQGVRDFKLAIFREAAEAGVDGISMDFVVYPPFFEKPDCAIMTQFIRDCREMLDEVGAAHGRRIQIMVRVPWKQYMELGLDWKTWMQEGLVDIVVPSHRRAPDEFDIPIEEFVAMGRKTGCKVYPTIWHSLGFVSTDAMPQDDKTGVRRYSKPKTQGMFFAQALLFNRAGADGLQIAMASGNEFLGRPWLLQLGDPQKVEFADKHYMVDVGRYMPLTFAPAGEPPFEEESRVHLRIGDDIPKVIEQGHTAEATLVFYCRGLQPDERLSVYVNSHGPVSVSGEEPQEREKAAPIDYAKKRPSWTEAADGTFIADRNWWKRGEHRMPIEADWLRLGRNRLKFVYSAKSSKADRPLRIMWVDLVIDYDKSG